MVGEEFLFAACSLSHVFLQQLNVTAEEKTNRFFVMGTSSDSCAVINYGPGSGCDVISGVYCATYSRVPAPCRCWQLSQSVSFSRFSFMQRFNFAVVEKSCSAAICF